MKVSARQIIFYVSLIMVGAYFLITGLIKAKPFLAPLAVAFLLTLLMIPVCAKMEAWGIKRGWAAFFSDLILLVFFAGLFIVLSAQVKTVAKDWPRIKEKLQPKIEQVQQYIARHTNISPDEQMRKLKETVPQGSGGSATQGGQDSGGGIGAAVMKFFGFLGTSLLIFIYTFFFLLYRHKFRMSFLKFFPPAEKDKAGKVVDGAGKISQNYLLGKLVLIILLAVLYAVGLTVSGIQHAILISLLAALLSLIPYIGNIIGFGLAIALGLFSGGGTSSLIGIVITFSIAQFVESYVLEPYIVGHRVDIHPVFTIIGVVLGEQVWGVVGMIIAIPVLGIFKIIFDHVHILKPLGYLLGKESGQSDPSQNMLKKIYRKIKGK